MADSPIINGNAYSWGSIRLTIDGEVYTGITSVTYADTRERAYVHGAGKSQGPRGRTRGKYTPDPFTFTMHRDAAYVLLQALADAGGSTSFGDTEFTTEVQYDEPQLGVVTDTLERCVVTKVNHPNDEGPDGLMTEFEAQVMFIRHNGLTLFDESA